MPCGDARHPAYPSNPSLHLSAYDERGTARRLPADGCERSWTSGLNAAYLPKVGAASTKLGGRLSPSARQELVFSTTCTTGNFHCKVRVAHRYSGNNYIAEASGRRLGMNVCKTLTAEFD